MNIPAAPTFEADIAPEPIMSDNAPSPKTRRKGLGLAFILICAVVVTVFVGYNLWYVFRA
jgi:hypothetical protein